MKQSRNVGVNEANSSFLTIEDPPAGGGLVEPPLVSVVIINHDYAEYVGEAIDSVREQDYPSLECVVVDNASTDDSLDVIRRHIADDARFSLIGLTKNIGQMSAALSVLPRLKGSFVAFVDSDDVLFPNFISSHVQVHLALPAPVAFTSSDIIETDHQRRAEVSGRFGFAAGCENYPKGLKPAASAVRLATVTDAQYDALSATTISVPHYATHWVWAPGTANVYRRFVLDCTVPHKVISETTDACDSYFNCILHLITGSALIARKLSIFRLHGRNQGSAGPLLQAMHVNREGRVEIDRIRRIQVLRTLLTRSREFNRIFAGDRFWPTIDLLCGFDKMSRQEYFSRREIRAVLIESVPSLVETFGRRAVIARLCERISPAAAWKLARQSGIGTPQVALSWEFATVLARSLLPRHNAS
jgi:glycosyltransferase involved in cell wall biosynthesis